MGPGFRRPSNSFPGFGSQVDPPTYGGGPMMLESMLCKNHSMAQSFLNQNRALINTLRANKSYDEALKCHEDTIAYIENKNTASLLSSNCTAYFRGLAEAKLDDKKAELAQNRLKRQVNHMFARIPLSFMAAAHFPKDGGY